MPALALFLAAADEETRWIRAEGGGIVARGAGVPLPEVGPAGEPEPALLIVPAGAVVLHRAQLPQLAPRQAAAAARLLVLENSIGGDGLHVAAGPSDAEGGLDLAAVSAADMAGWIGWAAGHGFDPVTMVPAQCLLPHPAEGFVRADLGGVPVARDASSGFVIEDPLAALVIGEAPVIELDEAAIDGAILAALGTPPLDLRQGPFARRTKPRIDFALVRRACVLAAACAAISLAIALVTIVKLNGDTARLDTASLAAARSVVPGVSSIEQAQAALDAQRGANGAGPTAEAALLFAAMDQVPGVSALTLEETSDNQLRATLAASRPEDLDAAAAALRSFGAAVASPTDSGAGGRRTLDVTIGR